jgi:hypothetical protein
MFDAWKKAWVQRNKDGTVDGHPEDGMALGASMDPAGHETSGPSKGLPVVSPFVPRDLQNARSPGEAISSAPNPAAATISSQDDLKTDLTRSDSDEKSDSPRPSKRRKVAAESVPSPAQATIKASDLDDAIEVIKQDNRRYLWHPLVLACLRALYVQSLLFLNLLLASAPLRGHKPMLTACSLKLRPISSGQCGQHLRKRSLNGLNEEKTRE